MIAGVVNQCQQVLALAGGTAADSNLVQRGFDCFPQQLRESAAILHRLPALAFADPQRPGDTDQQTRCAQQQQDQPYPRRCPKMTLR